MIFQSGRYSLFGNGSRLTPDFELVLTQNEEQGGRKCCNLQLNYFSLSIISTFRYQNFIHFH